MFNSLTKKHNVLLGTLPRSTLHMHYVNICVLTKKKEIQMPKDNYFTIATKFFVSSRSMLLNAGLHFFTCYMLLSGYIKYIYIIY